LFGIFAQITHDCRLFAPKITKLNAEFLVTLSK